MEIEDFFDQLEQLIACYDLLRHPFYQAWSRGELTREDFQEYAHYVGSFPRCLAQLSRRLEKSVLRKVVIANLLDELGSNTQRAYADCWLDFAEGMGAGRPLLDHDPPSQIKGLISFFMKVAKEGRPEEALAAFYTYESQVARISREKLRGLTEKYQASDRTCSYFILHMTADVYHARMWREHLAKRIRVNAEKSQAALEAAKAAALNLWQGLSGIQSTCLERLPQAL